MVSLIICFYEQIKHLKYCLDSLQFCAKDFDEVIISDDGSSESTVNLVKKMISNYDFPIKHVWQPNEGFRVAAARNNGIRHADGNYLIFFDGDCMILSNTVKNHLRAAKPSRFVAGSRKNLTEKQSIEVLNSPISRQLLERLYQQLPNKEIVKEHRRYIKRTLLMRLGLKSPRKQSLGGHFSIHRKDIEHVNGYDENFVGWGGEDEDLGIRLVKAGIYCRSAITHTKVLHIWHPKEIGNKHWREGPNIDYFKRKSIPFYCENGLNKG